MSERRILTDQEVGDLVTRLSSLKWSWEPAEAEQLAQDAGWKIESRRRRSIRLDAGFGMATGYIELSKAGRVERIIVAACQPVSPEADGAQEFVQDAFAGVVAAATAALGEPTQRKPGSNPEVRWRGKESTVGVKRVPVQVDIFLATIEFIDDYDWAESRGL